jgi:hypothetical protein
MRYFQYTAFALAALMLCLHAGCSRQKKGLRKPNGPKSVEGQPLRVALYGWGLITGRIEVSIGSRKLDAVSSLLWPDTGIGSCESKITSEEGDQLRQLIADSRLRRFHPEQVWYDAATERPDSAEPRPGYSADWDDRAILIEWSDKRTVFDIPPERVRRCMPSEAQQGYGEIIAVANAVDVLRDKYAKLSRPKAATQDEIDRLHRELERAASERLPK